MYQENIDQIVFAALRELSGFNNVYEFQFRQAILCQNHINKNLLDDEEIEEAIKKLTRVFPTIWKQKHD